MRVPESLVPLFDYGVLDDVVRPLLSGKEAHVYLVISGGRYAVAKIYKDAQNRSFKHRAEYTEGRKVRNTRDQRAIANRSKHGREKDEAAWRSTEVDMIHRLHAAGVRVPIPYHFIEGVLLMELVTDAEGNPAPRLGDLSFDPGSARAMYDRLIHATQQMLCAGVIHGDLSEFNVLIAADGPVVIDFPQSVDSAHNANARKLLVRDVDNLHRFLVRHVPAAQRRPYAEEMWSLHERNMLTPDTRLRGEFRVEQRQANTASVLELIGDANRDERKRRDALGLRGGPAEPAFDRSQSEPQGGRGPGGRGPRPAPSQQSRGAAPKKEPAVYVGLKDEGLKFFRHLRDQQPAGGPRGGQQQRPRGPQQGQRAQGQPQGQRSQGQQAQQSHGRRPQTQQQQPEGEQSQSQPPQSQPPQAQQPQAHAHGERPRGQHPQGRRPQHPQGGQRPQQPQGSQRPQARHGQDHRPQAQHGERQQAQHPQGQHPQGQRPQGQHPQGQHPQGQHPQGQRPQGQRPQAHEGQRSQAQHSHGRRPPPSGGAPQPAQAPRDGAAEPQPRRVVRGATEE